MVHFAAKNDSYGLRIFLCNQEDIGVPTRKTWWKVASHNGGMDHGDEGDKRHGPLKKAMNTPIIPIQSHYGSMIENFHG